MANSCISHEEEDVFFDSKEDILSVSDSCSGSPGHRESFSDESFNICVSRDPQYKFFSGRLSSVRHRRNSFMKWLGSDLISDYCAMNGEATSDTDRIMLNGGAVMKTFDEENESSISRCCCSNEGCVPRNESLVKNIGIASLDDGILPTVDELCCDGNLRSISNSCSNRVVAIDDFERGRIPSSSQNLILREDHTSNSSNKSVRRRKKVGWLRRLGVAACMLGGHMEGNDSSLSCSDCSGSLSVRRVGVRSHKKRFKEFSAVYFGQDIKAHDGAILTMKFSPDGQYLASGGDDRLVRVWSVIEHARTSSDDIPKDDPSCIYFMVNRNSELVPLYSDKEIKIKSRSSNSTCIVLPAGHLPAIR